jgi:hypothetical protein
LKNGITTLTSIVIAQASGVPRTNSVTRVAPLAPLSLGDLRLAIADICEGLAGWPTTGSESDQPPDSRAAARLLRDLHEALVRSTASSPEPPVDDLKRVAAAAGELPTDATDVLGPRPRTVYRLLRAQNWAAAWQVLTENAVGVVEVGYDASTATGQPRSTDRLPLLTRVEPPTVYAELPGFRDPRYGASDECYDISASVRLKHHLDEICMSTSVITLGGWAALDLLATDATESVRLVLSRVSDTEAATETDEISVVGRRRRRADLVTGRGDALSRRAWAGWAVAIDLGDPRLRAGSWELAVEIDHQGLTRRAHLGSKVSELAHAAAAGGQSTRSRTVAWDVTTRRWRLVISERRRRLMFRRRD